MSELNGVRIELTLKTFRDSADEDYLIARNAARLSLGYQFSWSAAQALEKYAKCIFVLNGESVRNWNHNFSSKLENLFDNFPEIFPAFLDPPTQLEVSEIYTYRESSKVAITRFCENGAPSRRYRQGDLAVVPYDLHKLDQLTFWLRRACRPFFGVTDYSKREAALNSFKSVHQSARNEWNMCAGKIPSKNNRFKILSEGNLAHFGESALGTHNQWFASYDSDKKTLLQGIGGFSDDDVEWARQMFKG